MPAQQCVGLDDVQSLLPEAGAPRQKNEANTVAAGQLRTMSCWRSKAFSAIRSARLRVVSERIPGAIPVVTGLVHRLTQPKSSLQVWTMSLIMLS